MTSVDVVKAASATPDALRGVLKDSEVLAALEAVGVQLTIYELHAPSEKSKTSQGLGPTLCGDRARRHPSLVTCKRCLKKRADGS